MFKDKFSKVRQYIYDALFPDNKYARWINWMAVSMLGAIIFTFFYISAFHTPSFTELENPKYDLASIIYDVNGTSFGRYYIEDRVNLDYNEISPLVKNTLLATEDDRFYSHSGIDIIALSRVFFKSILLQRESSGGGSTISQQLAKLLFKRPSMANMSKPRKILTLIGSKFKEWVIAVKLEKRYTKDEILAMYLNKFEFINGAHGIEAASQTYFNKLQKDLNVSEAATLIGMLKNPSLYNPIRFPEKSADRRNVVLSLMENAHIIDKAALDSLIQKPIDTNKFKRSNQSDGPAPYFRAELTKWLKDLFNKKHIVKSDGTEYNVYKDGLKIYTTIDLNYQKLAEESVLEHMKTNQDKFWRVWKNLDPWVYEADDYQKKLRADILENQCKASDRYLSLRQNYLGDVLSQINNEFPNLSTSDNIIKSLISIENKEKSWSDVLKEVKIEAKETDQYITLMESAQWTQLKAQFVKLQEQFKKDFSTPIKMWVFDYENGEKEVEMSPLDSVRYHQMHLQAGMMVLEAGTGQVKAWVGGLSHKYFKYDHVTMRRSVGSTIKPFVYTQAMAVQNISPCQKFDDIQYTITPGDAGFDLDKEWSPANANELFTGNQYNLYQGLLYSKNSITVRLVKEMGTVQPIRNLLRNLGIPVDMKLPNGSVAVPNLPAICLGAVDLTVMEMTGAYGTFVNNGTFTQPIFVTKIEDKQGKVIYQAIPDRKSAINPLYNAIMVDMLRNNVSGRFGMGIKTPIGGKTGTTNDYADAWFMSITPNMVVGIWTGGDDKWIRFLSLNDGEGYTMARPIAQKFYRKVENLADSLGYNINATFTNPPEGFYEMIDCDKYKYVPVNEEKTTKLSEKLKMESFDEEFE
ncbi:MAG: transglycosylase domain-containing protein [Lewinellaceae bacterium]|nr:transglycosylase domain-containing protein [Lewinellaceae bacterium]